MQCYTSASGFAKAVNVGITLKIGCSCLDSSSSLLIKVTALVEMCAKVQEIAFVQEILRFATSVQFVRDVAVPDIVASPLQKLLR
jgi:hypothetical protein